MASKILASKKLVLVFENGRYSFSQFSEAASEAACYALAMAINSLQAETPEEILLVTRSEIL